LVAVIVLPLIFRSMLCIMFNNGPYVKRDIHLERYIHNPRAMPHGAAGLGMKADELADAAKVSRVTFPTSKLGRDRAPAHPCGDSGCPRGGRRRVHRRERRRGGREVEESAGAAARPHLSPSKTCMPKMTEGFRCVLIIYFIDSIALSACNSTSSNTSFVGPSGEQIRSTKCSGLSRAAIKKREKLRGPYQFLIAKVTPAA